MVLRDFVKRFFINIIIKILKINAILIGLLF